jgi:hypothetical protein
MVTRKVLASLAAAGLVFGSTAAAAAPVKGDARVASPMASAEGLGGGSAWPWVLALLIVVAVIGVIAADNNEDLPHSP